MQEIPRKGYYRFGLQQEFSLSRQSLLALCRDMGFLVSRWSSQFCELLLCRDVVFHVTTVFLSLYHDHVAIEVSMSRPRRP